MAQIYRERLMALSPAERWERGARMFDAARTMVLASFPPHLSITEIRLKLLQRFYPELDTEPVRRAILAKVNKGSPDQFPT
ncbi:MAG TPA: hypothetical protein VIS74_02045 [Chthoniobacterales bacterium]